MNLCFVVAMARNRVIGRDNALPWHLPGDLRFFKRTTLGKPVIMGRRTHESIGRALPGRLNIVVTTRRDYAAAPDCTVVDSVEAALEAAGDAPVAMVIGGASLFEALLDRVRRIYLTRVEAEVEGDVRFPALDPAAWRERWCEAHPADERHEFPYTFTLLERVCG